LQNPPKNRQKPPFNPDILLVSTASQFFRRQHEPVKELDVLLLALVADIFVTHNVRDFHGSEQLGVVALRPGEYLNLIHKKS
jgi:hypothetical protein